MIRRVGTRCFVGALVSVTCVVVVVIAAGGGAFELSVDEVDVELDDRLVESLNRSCGISGVIFVSSIVGRVVGSRTRVVIALVVVVVVVDGGGRGG